MRILAAVVAELFTGRRSRVKVNIDIQLLKSLKDGCELAMPKATDKAKVYDCLLYSYMTTSNYICCWAARYSTWLLTTMAPKGIVFSFRFPTTYAVNSNSSRHKRRVGG